MSELSQVESIVAVVGGACGLAALLSQAISARKSYLRIGISADHTPTGAVLLTVTVESSLPATKPIDCALVIIGPVGESPISTFNTLAPKLRCLEIRYTDEIRTRKLQQSCWDSSGRAIVLLPFFYSEQCGIMGEAVSYTLPLQYGQLDAMGLLEARFYVAGPRYLHRSTQTVFEIPERSH